MVVSKNHELNSRARRRIYRQTMSKPQIIYFAYIRSCYVATYFLTKKKHILFVILSHGSWCVHTFAFSKLFKVYWLAGWLARTQPRGRCCLLACLLAWMNELVILTFTATSKLYVIIIAIIPHSRTPTHTMNNDELKCVRHLTLACCVMLPLCTVCRSTKSVKLFLIFIRSSSFSFPLIFAVLL